MTKPTEQEIDDLANQAMEIVDSVGSRFPGMSYEEGVANALMWVNGDFEKPTLDD